MSDQELPVSDLLAARRIADAGPDFWADIEAQLATESSPLVDAARLVPAHDVDTEVDTGDSDIDELQRRRIRRWLIVTAAAAAIVAIIFGVNALTEDTGPAPVVTDITTTTTAATTTTTSTTTTTTTIQAVAPESYGLPLINVAPEVSTVDVPSDGDGIFRALASASGGVVVRSGAQLVRIDEDGQTTATEFLPPNSCCELVEAGGAVFVLVGSPPVLRRVDIDSGERPVVSSYPGGAGMGGPYVFSDGDAVWVIHYDFATDPTSIGAEHIDARSGEVVARLTLGGERDGVGGESFAVGAGSLWAASFGPGPSGSGLLRRYDPVTGQLVAEIDIPTGQGVRILARDDAVWAITLGAIFRIDPAANEIAATIDPPDGSPGFADAAAASDSALFIKSWDEGPPALYRIDANTNTIDAVIDLGASSPQPWQAVISGSTLWFATPVFGGNVLARVPLDAVLQPPD